MGERIDLLERYHGGGQRDYYARVNNPKIEKYQAATRAKRFDFDYWDGDRSINYGGYTYRKGYWDALVKALITRYGLNSSSRVLDIGCGKGFLLYDLQRHTGCSVAGVDISDYALGLAPDELVADLVCCDAARLPFENQSFDLVLSINTLHNLLLPNLIESLKEVSRVSKSHCFINVESYSTELQKQNLLYWQVTCEAFYTPEEWNFIFELAGYQNDYGFIFFD